jgi:hypothetical protein
MDVGWMDGEGGMDGWRERDGWMEREGWMNGERGMDELGERDGWMEREGWMDGERGMDGWRERDGWMEREGWMNGERGMDGWRERDRWMDRKVHREVVVAKEWSEVYVGGGRMSGEVRLWDVWVLEELVCRKNDDVGAVNISEELPASEEKAHRISIKCMVKGKNQGRNERQRQGKAVDWSTHRWIVNQTSSKITRSQTHKTIHHSSYIVI